MGRTRNFRSHHEDSFPLYFSDQEHCSNLITLHATERIGWETPPCGSHQHQNVLKRTRLWGLDKERKWEFLCCRHLAMGCLLSIYLQHPEINGHCLLPFICFIFSSWFGGTDDTHEKLSHAARVQTHESRLREHSNQTLNQQTENMW